MLEGHRSQLNSNPLDDSGLNDEQLSTGGVKMNALNVLFSIFLMSSGAGLFYIGSEVKSAFIDPPEFQEAQALLPEPIYERLKESKKVCVNGSETHRSCMAIWKDVRENTVEVSNQ